MGWNHAALKMKIRQMALALGWKGIEPVEKLAPDFILLRDKRMVVVFVVNVTKDGKEPRPLPRKLEPVAEQFAGMEDVLRGRGWAQHLMPFRCHVWSPINWENGDIERMLS